MPILAGLGPLGMPELLIIALIVVLIFGAGRLPEVGGAVGRSIREFRKATKDDEAAAAAAAAGGSSDRMSADVASPAPVAEAAFCSECGTRNAGGAKFCSQCGHSIGAAVS